MKKLNTFAEVYRQWQYVAQEYGQDDNNFPLLVILYNCHDKMSVEITRLELVLNRGEPAVKLSTTNKGEILITRENIWVLDHGQTKNKQTIFTHDL